MLHCAHQIQQIQKRLDCVWHYFVPISLVEIVRRLIYLKITAFWKHSERKGTFYPLEVYIANLYLAYYCKIV